MINWIKKLLELFWPKKIELPVIVKLPEPVLIPPTVVKNTPTGVSHGVDLSHHNKMVDFLKLKDQAFVILKSTEGTAFTDSTFEARFLALRINGIKRGAYHFYRTNRDPIAQAKYFLALMPDLKGDEILALDYETCEIKGLIQTVDDLRRHKKNALLFLNYIKEKTGIIPWVYTSHSIIEEIYFEDEFAQFPLWYARYTLNTPEDKQGPWKNWIAWQYKENGRVKGVSDDVDMNWYKGKIS